MMSKVIILTSFYLSYMKINLNNNISAAAPPTNRTTLIRIAEINNFLTLDGNIFNIFVFLDIMIELELKFRKRIFDDVYESSMFAFLRFSFDLMFKLFFCCWNDEIIANLFLNYVN